MCLRYQFSGDGDSRGHVCFITLGNNYDLQVRLEEITFLTTKFISLFWLHSSIDISYWLAFALAGLERYRLLLGAASSH